MASLLRRKEVEADALRRCDFPLAAAKMQMQRKSVNRCDERFFPDA